MGLVELLEKDAVPEAVLHERYGALQELVRTLIGVVPACDPYLEIWPTAFRTYNVMVPNLLNLPFLIWGFGARASTLGLAMYASSRAAECGYCTAHTCTFAVRRGARADDVALALDGGRLSPADSAAVRVARAMSVVPATLNDDDRRALREQFTEADVEWIVLSVAMMGWLNKTMDALGVPLEESTAREVTSILSPTGWTPGAHLPGLSGGPPPPKDSLGTRLGVVRYAPSALRLDKQWTAGVPDRWPEVGQMLRDRTGHDFPILSRLRHGRAIRGIATMIRDNLGDSVVGRDAKLAAGLVYARTVGNASLVEDLRALGAREEGDERVMKLARAASPSPAQIDAATVDACRTLAPAAIVELVVFLGLMQLLHRVSTYYVVTT